MKVNDNSRASLLCLIATFAMLWIPLGQHAFLIQHWMKVGTFMAPFLLVIAFSFRATQPNPTNPDLSLISLGLLIAYIVHQFEEHWIDLYGNHYAFKGYVNSILLDRLGAPEGSIGPLSDRGVFVINTSLVWLVGAIAIWRSSAHQFPTLCMAAIVLVNAVSHLFLAAIEYEYNPGVLTAAVLFSPLATAAYVWLLRSGVAGHREVIASLVWGVLAHVVMVAGMIASGWLNMIREAVFFALLVGWSVLPTFLFRPTAGSPEKNNAKGAEE